MLDEQIGYIDAHMTSVASVEATIRTVSAAVPENAKLRDALDQLVLVQNAEDDVKRAFWWSVVGQELSEAKEQLKRQGRR